MILTVFKTVGRQARLVFGVFDSHTLPPTSFVPSRALGISAGGSDAALRLNFKTVGRQARPVFGVFDSHTLPPIFFVPSRALTRTAQKCPPAWWAFFNVRLLFLALYRVSYRGSLVDDHLSPAENVRP
ncbi:MAG: hypothetical protein JWO20_1226 [Candidatus Angelobacter sp.]|nr:hypothetical protein [Candidatus Angelobacter sp.]